MERVVEPELMEDTEQAAAYAHADFSEPNAAFCAHLLALFTPLPTVARALDLGTGPADIPIRLMRLFPGWTIDAVDGSAAMLAHAVRAVRTAHLQERIRLIRSLLPSASFERIYDVVLSNSLLHHLHDASVLWRTIREVARPGARVLVMDLRRPQSTAAARALVELHSGDEPAVLQRDFYNSLCAAYTPDEVEGQLAAAGLGALVVKTTSDRHLTVSGIVD